MSCHPLIDADFFRLSCNRLFIDAFVVNDMLSPQALSSPSISSFDGEWGVQLRHTLSGVNLSQDVWIMISSLCNVDPHRY